MSEAQKARVVEGFIFEGGTVVKIVRPGKGETPSFEIYTEEDGLWLVYPIESEIGGVMSKIVGAEEGASYHRTSQLPDGALAVDGERLEGFDW